MIILGLTGSIGMGKSTAAKIFIDLGVPVHDADAAVHTLLGFNGEAVKPLLEIFPSAKLENEKGELAIDRKILGSLVFGNDAELKKLEDVLHPMVRDETDAFLKEQFNKGANLVVLDIPLLYETKGEHRCDAVMVVTASKETQRKRVLAREGMTQERLDQVLAKQVPDAEKVKRADFVVRMEDGIDKAKEDIRDVLNKAKQLKAKAIKRLVP